MFRRLGIARVDGSSVDCPDDRSFGCPDGPCFGFDLLGHHVPSDIPVRSIIYSGTLSVAVNPSSGLVLKTGYMGGGQGVEIKSN